MLLIAGSLTVGALAEDSDAILGSTLIGSTPGQVIGGVTSGGLPWNVSHGRVTVNANGNVRLEVDGLILPSLGTTGPVTGVSASLVCGGSGGTVAATTAAVPLTPAGDARIHDKISAPASCIAPVILVRVAAVNGTPLAQPGPFIAATGFNHTSGDKDSKEQDSADRF